MFASVRLENMLQIYVGVVLMCTMLCIQMLFAYLHLFVYFSTNAYMCNTLPRADAISIAATVQHVVTGTGSIAVHC